MGNNVLQSLINDAQKKRSKRVDPDPISFLEVFLDKIEENRNDPNTLFTRKFMLKAENFYSN